MKKALYLAKVFCLLLISTSSFAQWTAKANAIKKRSEVTSIVYNNKFYTFLGFSDSSLNPEPSAEVYDPITNSWKLLSALPLNKTVTHQGVILLDDNVWHIGGRVGKNPGPLTSEIWIYNITNNKWTAGPQILDPATGKALTWAGGGAALLGRTLHIFGGFVGTGCNGDQDKYHLTLDVDTWIANPTAPAQWKNELAPLPIKRNHFGTVVLGGKIYAIGGQFGHDCGGGQDKQYSHVYNPATNTWAALPTIPAPRSHIEGSIFAMDGKIYIMAGQGSGGYNVDKATIYDPNGNAGKGSWTNDANLTLPSAYEGLGAKFINNTLIISHGGQGSSFKTRNTAYTKNITRKPVFKLGFPSECANLKILSGETAKGKTLLFTIDGTKEYNISTDATWLTVNKNSNGLALPNGVDIEYTINTTQLAPGTYTGHITASGTGSGPSYSAGTYCVTITVEAKVSKIAIAPEAIFSGVKGTAIAPKSFLILNKGTAPLQINSLNITGTHTNAFSINQPPAVPFYIAPGDTYALSLKFNPPSTLVGPLNAQLNINSNDPNNGVAAVGLYGLSTNGEQGSKEPPLDAVVKTLGYNINVGGTALILSTKPEAIGDEVLTPLFQKAQGGVVTIKPVARYSPDDLLSFGYYTLKNNAPVTTQVGRIDVKQEQSLLPAVTSETKQSFDPGSATFGFFTGATSYANQNTYTEDRLNSGPLPHSVRIYPLKNREGVSMPNSYLVCFEPASNGDYQDYVFEVTNVKPTVTLNTLPLRINAGGASVSVNGSNWAGCSSEGNCNSFVYGGGFAYTENNIPSITGITSPTNQEIMKTEWTGGSSGGTPVPVGSVAFGYNIPVQNGNYLIRLHFVELNKNDIGLRKFDVNVEGGEKELEDFDIYAEAGGMYKAIYRDFPAKVTDGVISIEFIKQVENAKVSAIEIFQDAVNGETLEAEDAVLNGAIVASNQGGYNGTGFADFINASGDFVEWSFTKNFAGMAAIDIRYANGSSANRPLQLEINGVVVNTSMDFAPTGAWTTWNMASFNANLKAGTNTIRLTAIGKSGGNFDNLTWSELPPQTETLEAEDAVLNGAIVASNQGGYNGTGFADFINASGDFVEWSFTKNFAGMAAIDIRYANGSSANRPLQLEINGVVVNTSMDFAPTGAWTTWNMASFNANLKAGTNTIRLTAIGKSGGNFDNLTWSELPPQTETLEAEDAVLNGAIVASNQGGYNGTGFADFINASGDFVEWSFTKNFAGMAAIDIRYANGSSANRPLQLEINGVVVNTSMDFAPTGAWTTWNMASFNANLKAGTNTIRLTAIGKSGGNFDNLTWSELTNASNTAANRIMGQSVAILNSPMNQNELGSEMKLSVSPNPVSGMVKLSLGKSIKAPVEVSVLDITGKLFKSFKFPHVNSGTYSFSVETLPSGMYIIMVKQNNKVSTAKLIVNNN